MEATPPQPSPIASRASLSPRPNSHNPHSDPRSDNWSERGESRPLSPTSLSKRFQGGEGKGEGAGDHSRTEKSRQGNLGSHPASAGCLRPAGPHRYSPVRDTAHPLAARPLGLGRQLPSRGHRDATRNLRSGRAWNRPTFIKVCRSPNRNARSPMTHYGSHMLTLTRIGNKADPWPPAVAGTPVIPRGSLAVAGPALWTGLVRLPRPPTLADVRRSERRIHRSLGPLHGTLLHMRPASPATAGPPLGETSLRLYGDSLAQRQPPAPASSLGAHQRLWPADLYRASPTVRNPSASDSSGAEAAL